MSESCHRLPRMAHLAFTAGPRWVEGKRVAAHQPRKWRVHRLANSVRLGGAPRLRGDIQRDHAVEPSEPGHPQKRSNAPHASGDFRGMDPSCYLTDEEIPEPPTAA